MRSPLRRGMRAFLHAATLSLVWSQTANSNCPCLNSGADFGVTGALTPGIGGKRYNYGSSYGFASCAAHDSGKAPFCTGTSEDPMFCSESWCYVDPELCSTGLPPAQSAYFKDLFYSYSTCGSENTFQSWFTTSGSGYSQNHALTELATVVTNYVKNVVQVLEDNEAELRDVSTNCDYDAACPSGGCCACAAQSAWGSAPPLTFQQTLSLPLGNGVMPGSDACLSSVVSGTFQRVGSSEGSASRIGYQYYGSDEGTYMGWPGVEDCSTTYDPRFRDWYAGAAAGPKDVIIVIDTSGSMSYSGRMTLARDAAKKVLGTLTSVDYATVVGFSSSTTKYSSVLVQMSESNKNLLRTWMDTNLQANGGTNFVAAFAAVAQVISASTSATTNCNRVVLFLSDGEPNSWSSSDYSTATSQLSGYQLITYALGSGADSTILKQLACENEGILYEVADNANLGDVMAGCAQAPGSNSNVWLSVWHRLALERVALSVPACAQQPRADLLDALTLGSCVHPHRQLLQAPLARARPVPATVDRVPRPLHGHQPARDVHGGIPQVRLGRRQLMQRWDDGVRHRLLRFHRLVEGAEAHRSRMH